MRIGIHPVATTRDPTKIAPQLRDLARATEEAGCTHLLLMDHYLQLPFVGPVTDPVLEAYMTAGYLAACTEQVRLGLLVTGVTYRHPGLLGKIVATLDALSHGRAVLTLGAAWYEREHAAYGVPFPPLAERFERLEETLQIVHQLWGDDDGPFAGAHYQLAETICSPRPLQHPHPPIWIGGGGERKTLRLVARYADASNLIASSTAEVAHKLRVLDGHCADAGRDPASVERTLLVTADPFDDVAAFRASLSEYAALGITTTLLVPPPAGEPVAFVERVGREVVPAAADL